MEIYQHSKVITGILIGFALTHLLKGIAPLIQYRGRARVYWVHLVWVAFAFIYVISFWWWEFWLEKLPSWTFPLYLFITFYGVLIYLLCALLVPDDLVGYDGFRDYFYSRRRWLFGVLAAICIVDFGELDDQGRGASSDVGIRIRLDSVGFAGLLHRRHEDEERAFPRSVRGDEHSLSRLLLPQAVFGRLRTGWRNRC
jgi:hypothetical protein